MDFCSRDQRFQPPLENSPFTDIVLADRVNETRPVVVVVVQFKESTHRAKISSAVSLGINQTFTIIFSYSVGRELGLFACLTTHAGKQYSAQHDHRYCKQLPHGHPAKSDRPQVRIRFAHKLNAKACNAV